MDPVKQNNVSTVISYEHSYYCLIKKVKIGATLLLMCIVKNFPLDTKLYMEGSDD